ncbi:transposase [Natrinema ejinorense]|uniref:transposase n=1 Tax=Natrinema ejinorense TaxID=373386 RepID=UPI00267B7E42
MLLDGLVEMPRIRNAINLTELPAPSTLCRAFDRLDLAVWRVLLDLSVSLLPTTGVAGIGALGFDRSWASKHYTKRSKLTSQQLKATPFVETRADVIVDLSVTTTRKRDTQIAPSLINRTAAEAGVLLGDKGYDEQQIRAMAREGGIRPLKHREFSSLQKAWNARLNAELHVTEPDRNGELSTQAKIRCIRPFTTLVDIVDSPSPVSSTISTELSNEQYRGNTCRSVQSVFHTIIERIPHFSFTLNPHFP